MPVGPWSSDRIKREQNASPQDVLVPFFVSLPKEGAHQQPIGFVLPSVLTALEEDNTKMSSIKCSPCWAFAQEERGPIWAIAFADWINEDLNEALDLRTEHMDRVVRNWKEAGLFPDPLQGWRDERYCVWAGRDVQNQYKSCPSPLPGGELLNVLYKQVLC